MVLDRFTLCLVIQRGGVVERFNSDLVTKDPTLTDAKPLETFDTTLAYLQRKNTAGHDWRVTNILDHRADGGKTLEFQVDCDCD